MSITAGGVPDVKDGKSSGSSVLLTLLCVDLIGMSGCTVQQLIHMSAPDKSRRHFHSVGEGASFRNNLTRLFPVTLAVVSGKH